MPIRAEKDIMKRLKLSEYINALDKAGLTEKVSIRPETADTLIECLTYDTRELSKNAIFVCKGAHFKKEYAAFAAENGAAVLIAETEFDVPDLIKVRDIRKAMPILAKLFYDDAPSKVTSIGITGTKGKSTTAYYIRAVLDAWAKGENRNKCAVISSIDTYDGVESFESHLTTPESIQLYKHFNNAYESGIEHLVMEVSSQALKYDRVDGITFDVAVFTNIGTDHISPVEHENFEDYYSSKLKIFDHCRTACINTDADFASKTLSEANGKCRIVTYGSHESDDIYCSGIEKRDGATWFKVRTPEYERELCITMPGIFNVSNALATIAVCYVLGIPEKYVAEGLYGARAGGRMQVYESSDKRVTVIVDYAHNKMSFEALYDSTRTEYPGKKMISVFGCPGYKAYLRRHDLGKAAGDNCDYVILTEEDSGEEPFESIAKDIAANIENCPYDIIEDRGEAIRHAVMDCLRGEKKVILLTGKGEETRQKRGTLYIDCPSDVDYTLKFLEEYDKAALPVV